MPCPFASIVVVVVVVEAAFDVVVENDVVVVIVVVVVVGRVIPEEDESISIAFVASLGVSLLNVQFKNLHFQLCVGHIAL